MRLLRLCRSSMNIRFPTILFFRIQRCNSFPFQPRSHMGPLISSLGCFSKFPRIPILSYTPNMALFSFQRSTTLRGGRVTLTWNNLGIPREKLLQVKGNWPHRPLPVTQERLPAIALVSLLQQPSAGAQEGGPDVAFKEITRTVPAGLTLVLCGHSLLGLYPGSTLTSSFM